MNKAELPTPGYLLWSVQRALLNEVTPDLPGGAVGLEGVRVSDPTVLVQALHLVGGQHATVAHENVALDVAHPDDDGADLR